MTVDLPTGVAARAHRATDPLHSLIYFAPEGEEEFTGIGLRPGRMGYFAGRSAPMGAVSAGVTAATFYNFNPAVVARVIPRAWTLATPEAIVAARFVAVDRALRRLLGDDGIDAPEVREAAELARAAVSDLDPAGRPLYAAHAGLEWPDAPHLVLWHAVSLLREHRGDGHIAALLAAGLSGIESIVTHTATGRGFTEAASKLLRGWSDEEWAAALDGLAARGLVADGELSEAGVALRVHLEDETDRMAAAPYLSLGPDRTARLTELGKGLCRTVAMAGAFPGDVFATAK